MAPRINLVPEPDKRDLAGHRDDGFLQVPATADERPGILRTNQPQSRELDLTAQFTVRDDGHEPG